MNKPKKPKPTPANSFILKQVKHLFLTLLWQGNLAFSLMLNGHVGATIWMVVFCLWRFEIGV